MDAVTGAKARRLVHAVWIALVMTGVLLAALGIAGKAGRALLPGSRAGATALTASAVAAPPSRDPVAAPPSRDPVAAPPSRDPAAGRAAGSTRPAPRVRIERGAAYRGPGCLNGCSYVAVRLTGFPPAARHTVRCAADGRVFRTYAVRTDRRGSAASQECRLGLPGRTVRVTVGTVRSNAVRW